MSSDCTKEVMIKTLALAKEQLQNYKAHTPKATEDKMIDRLRLHAFNLRRSNPGSVSHDLAAHSIEEACEEIEKLQYLYDKAMTDIVKTSELLSIEKRKQSRVGLERRKQSRVCYDGTAK